MTSEASLAKAHNHSHVRETLTNQSRRNDSKKGEEGFGKAAGGMVEDIQTAKDVPENLKRILSSAEAFHEEMQDPKRKECPPSLARKEKNRKREI